MAADSSWLEALAHAMARAGQADTGAPLIRPLAEPPARPLRPMTPYDRNGAIRTAQRRLERGWTGVSSPDYLEHDLIDHAAEHGYAPMSDDKRQRLAAQLYSDHEQQKRLRDLIASAPAMPRRAR